MSSLPLLSLLCYKAASFEKSDIFRKKTIHACSYLIVRACTSGNGDDLGEGFLLGSVAWLSSINTFGLKYSCKLKPKGLGL